jgi:hypothetical protein
MNFRPILLVMFSCYGFYFSSRAAAFECASTFPVSGVHAALLFSTIVHIFKRKVMQAGGLGERVG